MEIKEMWYTEVRPLVEELEKRELRANHMDSASNISEIMDRFESTLMDEPATIETETDIYTNGGMRYAPDAETD